MVVLVDFNLITVGTGLSMSKYIADCEIILQKYGLETNIHALGTNIEGEWSIIAKALEECHEYLHNNGVERIFSNIKLTSRTDKEQHIQEKIDAVTKHLK
jgi:uncharacterized protein (TIGR00106 family)